MCILIDQKERIHYTVQYYPIFPNKTIAYSSFSKTDQNHKIYIFYSIRCLMLINKYI